MLGREKVLCVDNKLVQLQYIGERLYVIDGQYFLISKDIDVMKPGVLSAILELAGTQAFAPILNRGDCISVAPGGEDFPNSYCVAPSVITALSKRVKGWAKIAAENFAELPERRLIVGFSDLSCIYFMNGGFNEWYVHGTMDDNGVAFWTDPVSFPMILHLCNSVGFDVFHKDYVTVYALAGREVKDSDLAQIKAISETYPEDLRLLAHKVFAVSYAMFVSENNKEYSMLGKRVRRHAVEMMLVRGLSPEDAIIYDRGRSASDIALECANDGY